MYLIGDVSVLIAAGAAWLFVVLYQLTAKWETTPEGRHLMTFTALLALIFSWLSYRVIVSDPANLSDTEEYVRAAIYTLAAGFLLWRCQLLWQRQIGPRLRNRRSGKEN
jgi:O-antigen ligase